MSHPSQYATPDATAERLRRRREAETKGRIAEQQVRRLTPTEILECEARQLQVDELQARPERTRTTVLSESCNARHRPFINGDASALHPEWRRQTEGRLVLQRHQAVQRITRAVGLPRARQACLNGHHRPAHRSAASTRGSPSSSDDPGSDTADGESEGERRHVALLLAGSDRRISEAFARVGAAIS